MVCICWLYVHFMYIILNVKTGFTFCNYKKDREGGNQLGDQTFNLKSSPGTICTSDARAMDFYYQIEHIPSGAMEVCATIKTFSQISTPETICISVAGKNISNPTFHAKYFVHIIKQIIYINT